MKKLIVSSDILDNLPEFGPASCHTCCEWGCRDDNDDPDGDCSCDCHFWQTWVENAKIEIKRLQEEMQRLSNQLNSAYAAYGRYYNNPKGGPP